MNVHDGAHVIVDDAEGRQQCAGDSGQGEQEVYAGYLRTGHVARWAFCLDIIAAPGGLPPLDSASAKEIDDPAGATDARVEILLLTAEGQKVRVSHARAVRRRPPLRTDGRGDISKAPLTSFGGTLKARSCVASLQFSPSPCAFRIRSSRILRSVPVGRVESTRVVSAQVTVSGDLDIRIC